MASLILDLPDQTQQGLEALARSRGITLESLIEEVLVVAIAELESDPHREAAIAIREVQEVVLKELESQLPFH